jgi:hypothetical protein
MPLTISDFKTVAQSSFFGSRDVTIDKNEQAKLGNLVFSSGKKINEATMKAFKEALENEYGVFGTHAFDTVVGARQQMKKSLRACDVKATLSQIETLKKTRFANELNRQLDTNPKFRELPEKLRATIRETIADAPFEGCDVSSCKTPSDMAHLAAKRIASVIYEKRGLDDDIVPLAGRKMTETTAKANEPTGLRNLKTIFKKGSTSVEDRIKKGSLGAGMRVNRSSTNPVLLEKVKTNGVEPGFIFRNDWSKDDTRGFMADINSAESREALETLKKQNPELAQKCEGKSLREQIMLAGRAHPAAMAAASEYMLEKAVAVALGTNDKNEPVSDSVANLAKALKNYFNEDVLKRLDKNVSDPKNTLILKEAKTELFTDIRDAVMGVKEDDAEYDKSPVFKHFADRAIMKLDYNESESFWKGDSIKSSTFRRPERILMNRKPILGSIYRFQTRQSADKISSGAVTEALANDLTRLAGVPAQELEIVRGQYSDGHPKIMLAAKFATGYKDMEDGMLQDGRAVPPTNPDGSKGPEPEPLGKYKAFFLLTADRDGIGKRGQNKGFINGKFFAIDPGHSLEGNGKYLEVADDFSFKDTYGTSTKPRFNNFSVFDDDTRFSKLQGLVNLRDIARSGTFDKLFDDYRKAFDPKEKGISDTEKALRTKIIADIDKKQTEFRESLNKLLKVGGMQLEMYDDLAKDGPEMQEGAIETIANLEKLTSPTTWVSKKGQVPLKHLEVKPETRIPWRAGVEGDNLVYHCDKPIPEKAREILQGIAAEQGATFETDAFGTTRLIIPKNVAKDFFAAFNEDKVAQLTHPKEHEIRRFGGDGLLESVSYQPFEPAVDGKDPNPPLTADQLPETLDIEDETGRVVHLPKIHYETMATTSCPGVHRPRSVEELRAQMEARVRRGNEILRSLLQNDNVSRFEANEQNIAALTIALHVAALKKGEFMYRGSFSIEDPNGNIARWLDTNPNIYLRSSTHATTYQHLKVDGHLNMPRGLDVKEGMGGLLNGMRTFHYFSIPDQDHLNDAGGSGPKRRLFLKCETYGIYWSTAHVHPNDKKAARSEGMHTRWAQFGDVCESLKHMASLFRSFTTSKTATGIRKENIPDNVKNTLKLAELELRKSGFIPQAESIKLNDVLKGGGIKMFLDNFNNALKGLPEDRAIEAWHVMQPFLDQIENQMRSLVGNVDDSRMGNEILIDAKDF